MKLVAPRRVLWPEANALGQHDRSVGRRKLGQRAIRGGEIPDALTAGAGRESGEMRRLLAVLDPEEEDPSSSAGPFAANLEERTGDGRPFGAKARVLAEGVPEAWCRQNDQGDSSDPREPPAQEPEAC